MQVYIFTNKAGKKWLCFHINLIKKKIKSLFLFHSNLNKTCFCKDSFINWAILSTRSKIKLIYVDGKILSNMLCNMIDLLTFYTCSHSSRFFSFAQTWSTRKVIIFNMASSFLKHNNVFCQLKCAVAIKQTNVLLFLCCIFCEHPVNVKWKMDAFILIIVWVMTIRQREPVHFLK